MTNNNPIYHLTSEQIEIANEIGVELSVSARKGKKICVKHDGKYYHLGDIQLPDYFHGASESQRKRVIMRFSSRASQSIAINLVLMINWACFDYLDHFENYKPEEEYL